MNDETAPQMMGDYEILGVLGAGGMGKVYKVRNMISDRVEAMKVLLPDLAGQKELADRFLREIKLLASLDHPNIAALHTAQTVGNQLVMIMEFVEGSSLSARLQQGPIPVPEAAGYIDQALAALGYAHSRHIIHRDIKPANMMVTPQGVLKLMDFGIAKSAEDRGLTMTGTTLGSLYYMSPEQVKAQAVDARSDLYSVAVSFYEMVTGRRPFEADSGYAVMAAHLEQVPMPPIQLRPDLPEAVSQLILMGMAKDPGQRFQTADAFRNALKTVRDTLPGSAEAAATGKSAAPIAAAFLRDGSVGKTVPTPAAARPATPAIAATVPHLSGTRLETPAGPSSLASPEVSQPAAPPTTPVKSGSYRGLYMALGATIVVVVLVLGGLYIPRFAKTRANAGSAPAQPEHSTQPSGGANPQTGGDAGAQTGQAAAQQSVSPASGSTAAAADTTQPAANEAAPPSQPSTPLTGGTTETNPSPAPETSGATRGRSAPPRNHDRQPANPAAASGSQPAAASQGQPQAGAQQSGNPAQQASSADLDALEQQLDALSARAGAVKDSIDRLRQEQSAQGLGLRTDIAAAEEQMETYMGKAQAALQSQDAARTKRYMDLGQAQVEKLEKFLGR